jgi:hypothetical protein
MALVDNAWYVDFGDGSTTGYYGVTAWVTLTTKVCGNIIRQAAAPAVGSERTFICIKSTSGTGATGASEPTWTVTRGAINADTATINWQECTGIAALNGDLTNTPLWSNASIKGQAITLGQVIQNVAGTLILICTVAGTDLGGAEPSWAAYTTAGATTVSGATWVTLGASFAGWSAPHARLGNAITATWGQSGNAFFIASEHAETQASAISYNAPIGTQATPSYFYCVAKTTVPPVSTTTGATISTTGANSITVINPAGNMCGDWDGITFQAGSAANTASISIGNDSRSSTFRNCSFTLNNTSASSQFILPTGASGGSVLLNKCTFTFGSATGQTIVGSLAGQPVTFRGCTFSVGANVPTTLFTPPPPLLFLQGCDLSGFGSGKTLIGTSGINQQTIIQDCKLGASVTVAAAPSSVTQSIYLIRADSSGTNYRHEKYRYEATQTVETTIIRTGGATDGTTSISWKIVTTANSKWVLPFECIPITIWNTSTSAITTLTIYGTTTGGGVPHDDEIWVEIEYLGSSGSPLGTILTTTKASNLAASVAVNNSSDASTWGGGGAGNGFKITVPSFTPGQAGPINIYVKAAKASSTYYIDPRPSISGVPVSKSEILAPCVYANVLQGSVARQLILDRGTPF